MDRAALSREWRQFRLLSRDSTRKLLNAAVLSRDADPAQFALWIVIVVATPPWMFSVNQMFRYAGLAAASPAAVLEVVLAHRMFFVLYGMLATALLAALLWDALFPNQEDQEVLGALPVRPRTVAAGRLAAALRLATICGVAISGPSAVVFAVISTTHPALGVLPAVFVAHLLAAVGGAVFMFAVLLVIRAVVALVAGAESAERLATLLQLATVVALVEVFFYMPATLPALVRMMRDGGPWAMVLPPVWFGALYSWLVGADVAGLARPAALAGLGLAAIPFVVVPLYLGPARLMARRALESRPRPGSGLITPAIGVLSRCVALAPPTAGILGFTLSSLTRNRRHLLISTSYAGFGAALGLVSVITASIRGTWESAVPDDTLLRLPLVLMFFLAFGFRSAFKVPTDLEANWPFRLATPTVHQAAMATRIALLLCAVAPVLAVLAVTTLALGWPADAVASALLLDLAVGVFLVECAVYEWTVIPFACAHTPGTETARVRWLLFAVTLTLYAFLGAALQEAALASLRGVAVYVATVAVATAALAHRHRRRARRLTVRFEEEPEDALSTLSLSEALR